MNNTSPSPSPPPPTLSAPGPRATALLKLHADCTTHVLRTISYANFSGCFPTPSREVPSAVRNLHEQFTQKLGDVLRREFEVILQDRNVVESLNGLDRLVEEGRRRKRMAEEEAAAVDSSGNGGNEGGSGVKRPIPPHTLPARQLYLSHLAPSLAMYAAQIEERQGVLSKANAGLAERVLQQRRAIGALLEGLEGVVRDLGGSVDALTGEGNGNGNDVGGQEEEEDLERVREIVRGVEGDLRKRERERGAV